MPISLVPNDTNSFKTPKSYSMESLFIDPALSLEETEEDHLVLFQFPTHFPLIHESASSVPKYRKISEAEVKQGIPKQRTNDNSLKTSPSSLLSFPNGKIGTLYVYRSGKVMLSMSGVNYELSNGTDHRFHEDVVSIRTPTPTSTMKTQESDITGDFITLGQLHDSMVFSVTIPET
jgi:hypothetical protein